MYIHVYVYVYKDIDSIDLYVHAGTLVHLCVCIRVCMYVYKEICCVSVSPKGCYHGASPPFHFKLYAEKHCLVDGTLLSKHHVPLMHSPPLIFILGETLYMQVHQNSSMYMYMYMCIITDY